MFSPGKDGALQRDATRLQLLFFGFAACACTHLLLYNLRSVLMPFVLSGFLVAAVEPSAELLYRMLSGLVPPYRWCCCCCRRVVRSTDLRASMASTRSYASCGDVDPALLAKERLVAGHPVPVDEESRLPGQEDLEAELESQDVDSLWEGLCRMLAVLLTVSAIVLVVLCFVLLLIRGALHLQSSWPAYREGMKYWITWLDSIAGSLSKSVNMDQNLEFKVKAVYNNLLTVIQDTIYAGVTWLVQSLSAGLSTMVVVLLYVVLWLSRPLPMGGNTGALVRSYIWKKTLTSCCYGLCVTLLFLLMGLDLAYFFGMISFFMNYVPEVGAAFSMLVPVPVILLDGRLQSPVFCVTMAILGQMLLKLTISNFLEVKLVEQDAQMSIHPVWVLLGLNYFGYIWGPAGMLVSVPVLAILKGAAISVLQTEDAGSHDWVRTFLACLEGRPGAVRELLASAGSSKASSAVSSRCHSPRAAAEAPPPPAPSSPSAPPVPPLEPPPRRPARLEETDVAAGG